MLVRSGNNIVRYNGKPTEYYTQGTGGTITYDGDYKIHTFNSSDNFVISNGVSLDASVLIVGCGGSGGNGNGGGYGNGGGGGSAGHYSMNKMTLLKGSYTVIIGSYPGGTTTFNSVSSTGGSNGANATATHGGNGGNLSPYSGGAYASGGSPSGGGGGAGIASDGGNGIGNIGGYGGDGVILYISGSGQTYASGGHGGTNADGGNPGYPGQIIIRYRYK